MASERLSTSGSGRKVSGKGNTRVHPDAVGEGFWDRPALVNLMADLLLLGGVVLMIWSAATLLQRLPVFPLTQVVVTTPLSQVSRGQLEHTARTEIAGNFFTVNLNSAQAAFERLPWVRRADVRRLWPDGLEVALEEHQAVAKWPPLEGESRLVNDRGEVFSATTRAPLPVLAGPEGSAPRVFARHQEFAASLAVIGRVPAATVLSAREAWQLKLDDGVVLELGRDQPKHPLLDRLNRFTSHYADAKARVRSVGVVDMRYPNGFALRASKS